MNQEILNKIIDNIEKSEDLNLFYGLEEEIIKQMTFITLHDKNNSKKIVENLEKTILLDNLVYNEMIESFVLSMKQKIQGAASLLKMFHEKPDEVYRVETLIELYKTSHNDEECLEIIGIIGFDILKGNNIDLIYELADGKKRNWLNGIKIVRDVIVRNNLKVTA